MKRYLWLLLAVPMLLVSAQERADDAPVVTLRAFWAALSAGDAEAFRTTVDLPLTLQDLTESGQAGVRMVVEPDDWEGFRRAFPAQPEAGPALELSNLRVDTVGKGLAVVTYNVGLDAEQSSKQTATLVDHDGWKVVFATLPAADAQP